jgi:hypothetical protein
MIGLGVIVFAIARAGDDRAADPRTIRVTPEVRAQLATELAAQAGRPPSDAELDRAVEAWIDRELLYREGLALGLDEHDPLVRRRVVQKMEAIQQSLEPVGDPTEDELEAFLAENAARYGTEVRYDFVQLVHPKADDPDGTGARADLQALRDGADPRSIGPRVGTSRRYALDNVARTFGPPVAAAVRAQPTGTWTLVEGPQAWTLLRVDAAQSSGVPDLEANRSRVRADFVAERRREVLQAALQRLRAQYRIEQVP